MIFCAIVLYAAIFMFGYVIGFNQGKDKTPPVNQTIENVEATNEDYKRMYIEQGKEHRIEMRECYNRITELLDELSEALGVDEIELPSFGKVYLNQSKHLKEAIDSISLEDLN